MLTIFVITIVRKELFENETDTSTTFLFSFQRSWPMLSSTIKTYLKTYLKTKEGKAKNYEEVIENNVDKAGNL